MNTKTVGNLAIGDKFRTLLTRREGEVINPEEELGIAVLFYDTQQEKTLHPDIRVEVL
jgi:hypothetical protein